MDRATTLQACPLVLVRRGSVVKVCLPAVQALGLDICSCGVEIRLGQRLCSVPASVGSALLGTVRQIVRALGSLGVIDEETVGRHVLKDTAKPSAYRGKTRPDYVVHRDQTPRSPDRLCASALIDVGSSTAIS